MFSDEDANQYLDNETKLKRKPQNMVHEEQTVSATVYLQFYIDIPGSLTAEGSNPDKQLK